MYALLIISTIVISCINGGLIIDCPNSSAQWCDNKDIAQACGVVDQCNEYVWKVRDVNDRVNLSIYYEVLCPACQGFIATQVYRAYESILDILNITFVPYGNAHEVYNPDTQLYNFSCQHGAEECYGDLFHTCVIYLYPNTTAHLPFFRCSESTRGPLQTVFRRCAKKTSIDYKNVIACTESRLGNQLQHLYAVQTASLQPPHEYVPWVTVNGVHTEDIETAAMNDLIGLICRTYKGANPPPKCKKIL